MTTRSHTVAAIAEPRWTLAGTIAYWTAVALCAGVWSLAAAAWVYQVYYGLSVTGLTHPVMWGAYIATFVFWIGIAHAGTLMSAVLFLLRADWRRSIARAAETMTIAAILTACLFPVIHLGRPWRAYWLIPYPNERELWINFSSPLIWDAAAIATYFVASTVFWFIHLVPDFAVWRDRHQDRWARRIAGWLAFGWTGSTAQWQRHRSAYTVLAFLITLLVVSVHSIVSWDFAVAIVPGWHSTLFAPYFVAGAMLSGVAMLLLLVIPGLELFGLRRYVTTDHLDKAAQLLLALSLVISYCYAMEYLSGHSQPFDRAQLTYRFSGPYAPLTWATVVCNSLAPLVLLSSRARQRPGVLLAVAFAVTVGMWLERFVIIVASLAHEYSSYAWGTYRPSHIEITILVGSLGWFLFWFLLLFGHIPPVRIAPEPPVEDAATPRRSAVAAATSGGLFGTSAALAFQVWTVSQWPHVIVGGKPLIAWPTFAVIAFEMAILGATLATVGTLAIGLWRRG